MIYSDHPGFYRVKFSASEIAEKYSVDKLQVFLKILKDIQLGTNTQYTIEPDVDVWFPINYSEIWEC